MLLNKSTYNIIKVLVNEKDSKLKLRELSKKAKISLGMSVRIVNALESADLVKKSRGIQALNWEKLLKAWSLTISIKEYGKIEFIAPERPQYLIKKISQILSKEKYAFTLFSATEIISPYVAPDKVHLYILEQNKQQISKIFNKNNIMPAEKGNIICYLVDEEHFYNSKEIRGTKIISLPQLYVDLVSYGGRGEEAAQQILNLIGEENV